MSNLEGKKYATGKDLQPDDKVFIKAETISKRFKEYLVETTHKEIMETLNKQWKETKRELEGLTIVCYKNIVATGFSAANFLSAALLTSI